MATARLAFISVVTEVKLLALKQDIRLHQYLDNWLISAPAQAESKRHDKASHPGLNTGLHSKPAKIKTHSPAEVRFHRLPFFARSASCQTHKRQMKQNSEYLQQDFQEICHQCKDSYVHHWITSLHRENSETGHHTHETLSIAPQYSLEIPNASEFFPFLDSENKTTWGMEVEPMKHPVQKIPTPQGSQHLNLYRHLKRRMG